MRNNVIIAVHVMDSDENDVSESSASAPSGVQQLDNCIHDHPTVHHRRSNCDASPRPILCQTEPDDEFSGSTDASSVRSEVQSTSLLETMDLSETEIPDVREKNNTNDTGTIEIRNEPLLHHQMNHACDSLLANNKMFVTENGQVKCTRFKGIGPTDEDTGIPLASKSVSKT